VSRVSGAHLYGLAPGPTHQGCSGGESLATCGRFFGMEFKPIYPAPEAVAPFGRSAIKLNRSFQCFIIPHHASHTSRTTRHRSRDRSQSIVAAITA